MTTHTKHFNIQRIDARHTGSIEMLAIAPDSRIAASVAHDYVVHVWEIASGHELCVLRGHTARIRHIMFTADSQTIITVSNDRTLRVWEVITGHEISVMHNQADQAWFSPHDYEILSTTFTVDEQLLITASHDKTIKVWHWRTGELLQTLYGHEDIVTCVLVHPDGQRFFSAGGGIWYEHGSFDSSIRIWNLHTGEPIARLRGHGTTAVKKLILTPDESHLVSVASAAGDIEIKVWNVVEDQLRQDFRPFLRHCNTYAITESGLIAAGSSHRKRTTVVWNTLTGEAICQLPQQNGDKLAFITPDRILIATREKSIALWDLHSKQALWTSPYNELISVLKVALGRTFLIVCALFAEQWPILDLASGEQIGLIPAPDTHSCFKIAPDSQTIITGDRTGVITILQCR